MIKNSQMETFLNSKLHFERRDGRHSGFKLPSQLGMVIPGVLPLHLQHGRGEVASHILQQVRDFLGLSSDEFFAAERCDYSVRYIYINFIISQIYRLVKRTLNDPVVYDAHLTVLLESVRACFENIEMLCGRPKQHKGDSILRKAVLIRCDEMLNLARNIPAKTGKVLRDQIAFAKELIQRK